jgi:hypothetical protein
MNRMNLGLALILTLSSLALSTFTPQARDGPLIQIETVTSTPTVTVTVTSTPTSTSTPTPSPTPTNTPTPTLDPVIEISSRYKVERSLLYLPSIEQLNEYDLDPILVVSVIAAESGGDYELVSYAGACGPMQVIPKSWYPYSPEAICESSWANLIMGMRILRGAIDIADGDLRYGLAYYNCSEESVHNDRCGEKGGLHYADDVLDFWYPRVSLTLAEMED